MDTGGSLIADQFFMVGDRVFIASGVRHKDGILDYATITSIQIRKVTNKKNETTKVCVLDFGGMFNTYHPLWLTLVGKGKEHLPTPERNEWQS